MDQSRFYISSPREISKHFTYTAQKMKFPIKDFFSKCEQNLQFLANLVAFTEEIPNGKLHFLCSVCEMFFVQ